MTQVIIFYHRVSNLLLQCAEKRKQGKSKGDILLDTTEKKATISRKEVLPAFLIVLVITAAVYFGMTALQPLLMGNTYLFDFGQLMSGCIEGNLFYRVMWFLADYTETTFLACAPASVVMCIFAFIAAGLEKKKSKHMGTGVGGLSPIFSTLFFSASASMILGQLVFGSLFSYGWIPTFAAFLTVQAFIIYYGGGFAKAATAVVVGTLITFPVCHYLLQLVVSPLGLPLFIAVSAGVFVVVPLCTFLFKLMPWMTPAPPPAPAQGEALSAPAPGKWFVNQIFGDVGQLFIWGSSIAAIAMYIAAIACWALNPMSPGYSIGNFPTLICAQIATAALAIFIYYPQWKTTGMACTFSSIVFISAVLATFPSHPAVVISSILVAAFVGSPMVDLTMKLFKFRGQFHPIALVQFGIFTSLTVWCYVLKLLIIPALGI